MKVNISDISGSDICGWGVLRSIGILLKVMSN